MSENLTDKEQIEMLKKWWKDYGIAITIAILFGLGIGFGWRYWHAHKTEQAQQASAIYQSMQAAAAADNLAAMKKDGTVLLKQYRSTPYATMAAFYLAKLAVANNNLARALTQLQWVIANSKVASFRQIARIRAARVLLAQKKFKAADQVLAKIEVKSFAPMIVQVRGDILAAQGDHPAAVAAYEKAKRELQDAGFVDPIINMKIAG